MSIKITQKELDKIADDLGYEPGYHDYTDAEFTIAEEAQKKLFRELKKRSKKDSEEHGFYDGSMVILTEVLKPIYKELKMKVTK